MPINETEYLENNLIMIRDSKMDNMANSFWNVKGLKRLLKDLTTFAIKNKPYRYPKHGGGVLVYIDRETTDEEKHLLNLLALTNCIKKSSISDLTSDYGQMLHIKGKNKLPVFELLDLKYARFDRLRQIKANEPLNYSVVRLLFGKETANNVFTEFIMTSGQRYYDLYSLEGVVNYIWKTKTATLDDVAEFMVSHYKPQCLFGKYKQCSKDKEIAYIKQMFKSLDDVKWWRHYDIKIKMNSKVRRNRLAVNGNTLVFTEEKTTQKNAVEK